MADLAGELGRLLGDQHVLPADGVAVDGVVPRVVAQPGDAEQVAAVLRLAGQRGMAVCPRGGGTTLGLGAPPARADLVLDLGRLDRVLDHEAGDMTIVLEAGAPLSRVQEHLKACGQVLPLDSPSPARATVGGTVASNSTGPQRLRYGSARDVVIGVRVVRADGRIIKGGGRVVKNVTGYDMNKLFAGSLGTLGVLVEVAVRVFPGEPIARTWLALYGDLGSAAAAAHELAGAAMAPVGLALMNPAAMQHIAATAGLSLPAPGYGVALAVASVAEQAVTAQLDTAADMGRRHEAIAGLQVAELEHEKFWAACRDALPEATAGDVAATLKASVPLGRVGEIMARGGESAARLGLSASMIAEAGSGIVRFYLTGPPATFAGVLRQIVGEVRQLAAPWRGSVIVWDAPAAAKNGLDVWGPISGLPLMQKLKERFDPQRILNPGRFVGGI